jgi:hypothetical protein
LKIHSDSGPALVSFGRQSVDFEIRNRERGNQVFAQESSQGWDKTKGHGVEQSACGAILDENAVEVGGVAAEGLAEVKQHAPLAILQEDLVAADLVDAAEAREGRNGRLLEVGLGLRRRKDRFPTGFRQAGGSGRLEFLTETV